MTGQLGPQSERGEGGFAGGSEPTRFGDGLSFPTESDYLNAGNHSELQPAHVTRLAWVRSATTPAHVKGVVSQGATGTCDHSFSITAVGVRQRGLRDQIRVLRS